MPGTLTSPPRPAPADNRLLLVEDFAVAELDAPEIWSRLLTVAVHEQASDLHLTSQSDGVHIAVRIDGHLAPQGALPTDLGNRLINHVKVLAGLDLAEHRRPQDGHLDVTVDRHAINLRVGVLPTLHGEDVAIRVFERETASLDLDQLGLSSHQLRELQNIMSAGSGLVLVSGATGAGKTTTLYALLRRLADAHRKIVTVEDPIEYDLPGVNQSAVNRKLGLDFATLLRSVLRQDPNVIMVGEVRDSETADAVVRAANTGRLVFATTHAVHSAAAIETLVALGAHPHFVARAFRGALAQTLVRRLCPYCRLPLEETHDHDLLEDVRPWLGSDERPMLSLGRGCPHCRHSGYRSRVGVFEVLTANDEIRAMISQGRPSREIYNLAIKGGMIPIAAAGKLAALRGLTTIEELLSNISEIWTGSH